jgi:hypothetical protein
VSGRRYSSGAAIGQAYGLWLAHIVPLSLIGLLFHAPLIVGAVFIGFGDPPEGLVTHWDRISQIVSFFFTTLATGATTHGVIQRLRGLPLEMGASIRWAFGRFGTLLGVAFLYGLCVGVGIVLLIIPGLIVASMFCLATPAAVVEPIGAGGALERSSALTKGHRLGMLLALIVTCLPMLAIIVPITIALGLSESVEMLRYEPMITEICGALFGAPIAVVAAVLYHNVRIEKEGISTDELASVFD